MTDTTQIPIEVLAEFLRHQADVNGEVRVLAPEGVEDQIDELELIERAEFKDGEWADGDAHCWYECEVRLERKVRRAKRLEPADYRVEHVPAYVSMQWDMEHTNPVSVDIEVDA